MRRTGTNTSIVIGPEGRKAPNYKSQDPNKLQKKNSGGKE
jgi:hypothetical protein